MAGEYLKKFLAENKNFCQKNGIARFSEILKYYCNEEKNLNDVNE